MKCNFHQLYLQKTTHTYFTVCCSTYSICPLLQPWSLQLNFMEDSKTLFFQECRMCLFFEDDLDINKQCQVVVSNIFYFHPYLGKWSNLTNIFQLGWNHQPDDIDINKHCNFVFKNKRQKEKTASSWGEDIKGTFVSPRHRSWMAYTKLQMMQDFIFVPTLCDAWRWETVVSGFWFLIQFLGCGFQDCWWFYRFTPTIFCCTFLQFERGTVRNYR